MGVQLVGPLTSGEAAGNNGSARANQDTNFVISGLLEAVYIQYMPEYPDDPPLTTKVTLKTRGSNGSAPSLTLLEIDNSAIDGWFFPRAQVHGTNGSAISNEYDKLPVYDVVNVAIEEANEGNYVNVWLLVNS